MKIIVENIESGKVIYICADERLDLTAYGIFDEAAALAVSNPSSSAIVVDLGKTQQLFDSGRAMLLTLRERAGHLKNKIYLANVGPEIKYKLMQGAFQKSFHIMDETAAMFKRFKKPVRKQIRKSVTIH